MAYLDYCTAAAIFKDGIASISYSGAIVTIKKSLGWINPSHDINTNFKNLRKTLTYGFF